MIDLPKYNPCEEYINDLNITLSEKIVSNKRLEIRYDKSRFITNLTFDECKLSDLDSVYGCKFSDKGNLIVYPQDIFFIRGINMCPVLDEKEIMDIKLSAIIKRMFAQLEFRFFTEDEVSKKQIEICDNIFKSIYTKSLYLKMKNIEEALQKYNNLQKAGYLNKSVIYGIIYAVYEYYSCVQANL